VCFHGQSCSLVLSTLHNRFREAQEQAEMAKIRSEKPKIQQKFADLKRGLSVFTNEEWIGIPEVGNLTKKKRRREERTYVVPDSILVGERGMREFENSLDPRQQQIRSVPWPSRFNTFISDSLSRLEDLAAYSVICP